MDLNHRPPGPEPGALARLRYAPTDMLRPNFGNPSGDLQISIAPRLRLLHLAHKSLALSVAQGESCACPSNVQMSGINRNFRFGGLSNKKKSGRNTITRAPAASNHKSLERITQSDLHDSRCTLYAGKV
jgi:hypothetical protein